MRTFIVFPIRAGLRDVACKPAKKLSHGRPPCKYPDDLARAVLVDWLRGMSRPAILDKHGIPESALHGWTTLGNRQHIMREAEALVPVSERGAGR
jgi:hypothetical protein